jgi:acetyl esterase/lipase
MLKWTRFALSVMSRLVWHPPAARIEVAREIWGGIPVRVYVPHNRSSDAAVIFIHGGGEGDHFPHPLP